jgi:hypothetical protein
MKSVYRSQSLALWLWIAVVTVWGGPVWAHSMHQSAVLLDFRGSRVETQLQLPLDRLSISFGRTVDAAGLAGERAQLQAYVLAHIHPVMPDGRALSVQLVSMSIETVEQAPYLVVRLVLAAPGQVNIERFTLNYDVITHEIVTHVVLVYLRSDSRARIAPEEPLVIGVIRGERKSIVVDRLRLL